MEARTSHPVRLGTLERSKVHPTRGRSARVSEPMKVGRFTDFSDTWETPHLGTFQGSKVRHSR